MFRVIVTGSRGWTDRQLVFDKLDSLPRPLTVVHGAAWRGADLYAHEYCNLNYPEVTEEAVPADWGFCTSECRHPKVGYCLVAGFRRNGVMIDRGGDLVLSFARSCERRSCQGRPVHDSHGTSDCTTKARAAGLVVDVIRETD